VGGRGLLSAPPIPGVRRNDLNTRILIRVACASLVVGCGCSQPRPCGSSAKTAGPADLHDRRLDELPVHHETQTETLARVLVESEAAKSKVNGPVHTEWYGSTLLGLGRLRKITVPYVPAGSDGESREVTTPQIQKALTEYVLIDCEKFRSSTHIPMGTRVAIEYENGMIVGSICMPGFHGMLAYRKMDVLENTD